MRTASKETILRIAGSLLVLVGFCFVLASIIVSHIGQSQQMFAIGGDIVGAGIIIILIWVD